jgi:NAD(P)-dependent dehydrogenase (short-subunit alcohol dehydrogenase family)
MGFFYSQLFVRPAYPKTSFANQTVIVTGSNTGLGKEAARHIARLGAAKLILAVRNIKAGNDAKLDIEKTTKCDSSIIEVWSLDLASYDSVKSFADRASKLPRLDAVVENAGIATGEFSLAEGHERTITVNVISTFLLALLLLPKLKETRTKFNTSPRLTIVSSEVHAWTKFPEGNAPEVFPALDVKGPSWGERYMTSKLLEVLAFKQLAPKLDSSGVILNILNPGLCHSELGREGSIVLEIMKFFLARTTEVGSRTLVAAAEEGTPSHGKYMHDAKPDDGELSKFVTSKEGKVASEKVWKELSKILEEIQPGVTKSI